MFYRMDLLRGRLMNIYYIGGIGAVFMEMIGFIFRNIIRPFLPTIDQDPRFGDVTVSKEVALEYANSEIRLLDTVLPWTSPGNRWMYEHDLSQAIRETVSPGDTVVIIGGGIGVTAVVAAQEVAPNGSVIVYEGGEREVEWVNKTTAKNDVEDLVNVNHALVGPDINVYSNSDDAQKLSATELPPYDVLVSDCEGAERQIIKELNPEFETLLIETHGYHGSPTHEIESLLREKEYEVNIVGLESIERDVRILKAIVPN